MVEVSKSESVNIQGASKNLLESSAHKTSSLDLFA